MVPPLAVVVMFTVLGEPDRFRLFATAVPRITLPALMVTVVATPLTVPSWTEPAMSIVSLLPPSVKPVVEAPTKFPPLRKSRLNAGVTVPASVIVPAELLPICTLVAIMLPSSVASTVNVPAPPLRPIVTPALFGCRMTVPFVPVDSKLPAVKVAAPAVTSTEAPLAVARTILLVLTTTAPVPAVLRLTPALPITLPPDTVRASVAPVVAREIVPVAEIAVLTVKA